jgi:hypothetical protein
MTRANRMAYDSAQKCAVAGAIASDDRHKAGDDAKADAYRAKSKLSFNTAYALGERLGLSDEQVKRDLDFAQLTELPRMLGDENYYLSTVATCKALGLI